MGEHNTYFFSVGKSSVVTGIINQLIQKNRFRMKIQMRKLQHFFFERFFMQSGLSNLIMCNLYLRCSLCLNTTQ